MVVGTVSRHSRSYDGVGISAAGIMMVMYRGVAAPTRQVVVLWQRLRLDTR
ncbi:MAG: hypothetical protein ABFS08_04080 [Pseudomonadota bacterium]